MPKFEFSEYGRVYVPIHMKPLDSVTLSPVEFKVDTGADTTTISKDALIGLGYDMNRIVQNAVVYEDNDKPTTAAGEKINAGYVHQKPKFSSRDTNFCRTNTAQAIVIPHGFTYPFSTASCTTVSIYAHSFGTAVFAGVIRLYTWAAVTLNFFHE